MKNLLNFLMVLAVALLVSLLMKSYLISSILAASIVLLALFASKIVKIKKPQFKPFHGLNKNLSHQQPVVE